MVQMFPLVNETTTHNSQLSTCLKTDLTDALEARFFNVTAIHTSHTVELNNDWCVNPTDTDEAQ